MGLPAKGLILICLVPVKSFLPNPKGYNDYTLNSNVQYLLSKTLFTSDCLISILPLILSDFKPTFVLV